MAMATTPAPRHVDPDSELGRLLEEAADEPLLLEMNGQVFRVVHTPDDRWADDDPAHARRVLHEVAGSWRDSDVNAMIRAVYEARERGTRSIDEP